MNQLQVIVYDNRRVLTTGQLAESYGTDNKRISNNFNENKDRYKEGKHFLLLEGEELKIFKSNSSISGIAPNLNKLYLWTEKGAWLHAKSLNTDAAWDAYEVLVDEYYKVIEKKPLTAREQTLLLMQFSEETAKRVDILENDISQLKDDMRINSSDELSISSKVNNRVVSALGGKGSKVYSELSRKAYSEFWRGFKNHFDIARKGDLPKVKLPIALLYIEKWRPSTSLELEMELVKAQLSIDI